MNKNSFEEIILKDQGVFDIFSATYGAKTISLANAVPLKYAVLVANAKLDITIQTTCDDSELKVFILAPILENQPSTVNVSLNLFHHRCKIDLHMVSLIFSGEKNKAAATIYMEQGIKNSEARLLEETVICGDYANVTNIPILDIRANNIAAAHGAKIYRLDTDKMFYIQSKGLTAQQARNLLISTYPNMLFEGVLDDELLKTQIQSQFLDFSYPTDA